MGDEDGPRNRMLAAAIDHLAAQGVGDLSLRGLAEAIGTSHRMLIYHFGSKEGLLIAIVQAMEQRQRNALADLEQNLGAAATPAALVRQMWARLADPELAPHERLFFELYGRALSGERRLAPFLEGIVDMPTRSGTAALCRMGLSPDQAAAQARLGLAVVRGLLLDLLATGDRAAADRVIEEFAALLEASPTQS